MDSYTFVTKDRVMQLSVKKEFLEKCSNPEEQTCEDLFDTYQVYTFLHNTEKPAMIGLIETGPDANLLVNDYFINAKRINEDEIKNIKFKKDFKTGLNEALKNDE